jgi:hypothetical protein
MSIRLKRNFRKTMAKYGTLDKTHTNRIRMALSFATEVRKDNIVKKTGKLIEWFMFNNKSVVLHKIIKFSKRVRFI